MLSGDGELLLWLVVAAAVYGLVSLYVHRVEQDYRREYQKSLAPKPAVLLSVLIGGVGLLVTCWLARERIAAPCFVALALAAASLRGVLRVDRLLLLIPDRLQLIGLLGGLSYLAALSLSGEVLSEILIETAVAIGMVALLWLLSALYLRWRGAVGFGLGDTKLLGWLALFVGKRMPDLILIAIAMGMIQLLFTIAVRSFNQRRIVLPRGTDAFPFGPSIVLAAFVEAVIHYA